jgi:hypothetical protein
MKKNDKIFNKAVEKLQDAGAKASKSFDEVAEACTGLKNAADIWKADMLAIPANASVKIVEQKETDEWIWVTGYKGTDKNMKCRDYQFMLNYRHDMVNGAEIKLCESGFHFCPKIKDVFQYYEIGNGNRFFEVRALVRKKDYEEYKTPGNFYNYASTLPSTLYWPNLSLCTKDKLTSKAIEFVRELTLDEIFAGTDAAGWNEEDKRLAIEIGIAPAISVREVAELVSLGYSEQLSNYIVYELDRYRLAKFLTTLPENPSMDTKMIIIFGAEDNCSKAILRKDFVTPYTTYKTVTLTKDDIISPTN